MATPIYRFWLTGQDMKHQEPKEPGTPKVLQYNSSGPTGLQNLRYMAQTLKKNCRVYLVTALPVRQA